MKNYLAFYKVKITKDYILQSFQRTTYTSEIQNIIFIQRGITYKHHIASRNCKVYKSCPNKLIYRELRKGISSIEILLYCHVPYHKQPTSFHTRCHYASQILFLVKKR